MQTGPDGNWMSGEWISCADGSWLAYRNHCRKEKWWIPDTFVARGSDGIWYSSNYHFCIDAICLQKDGQPKSLAEFASRYATREFEP